MRAIVVGAGPAGLASAACLQDVGAKVAVLEKTDAVAASWRSHYDCLHLHTSRERSALPGMDWPKGVGKYPSRDELVDYLDAYAKAKALDIRFGCDVTGIKKDGAWHVTHSDGVEEADVVVVATGINAVPRSPDWSGTFHGPVSHSSTYRNAAPFQGQKVLVVGFGNSGGDIALDIASAGEDVTLSVRGPVNILPKELLGRPITSLGALSRLLGYKMADRLTAPIMRLVVGRPEDYGLLSAGKGPAAQVNEDKRIPLIDVGTLGAIKAGKIAVRRGVERLDGRVVHFADGASGEFDHIIAAIGYDVDLRPVLGDSEALDDAGRPLISGAPGTLPGLYFCSYEVSPFGQLYAMSREAEAIAADAKHPTPQ